MVDEVVVTPPLTFYIDTADVHCVEVLSGRGAALEYRRSMSDDMYSGVVLIWTEGSNDPVPHECAN